MNDASVGASYSWWAKPWGTTGANAYASPNLAQIQNNALYNQILIGGYVDLDEAYTSSFGQWGGGSLQALNVSTAALTLPSTAQGTAGSTTSFTVSGSGLGSTDALTLLPPTGSEISKDGLSFSGTFLLYPDASGNLGATSVYIRTCASATASVNGNLTIQDELHSSLNKSILVSGTVQAVGTPVLNVGTTTLILPTPTQGTVGDINSFTISGSGLGGSDSVVLSAATGSEFSLNASSAFGTTLTLYPNASGMLSNTTIYVRISASASASVYGDLNITDVLHSSQDKAIFVSGTVVQPVISVTVQTSPSNSSFTVDGVAYSSAQSFTWIAGVSHTLATTSPQSGGAGLQYLWGSWSDAGAISHSITPTTGSTYTASFSSQGSVSVLANPTNGGSVVGGGQYLFGSNAMVMATASNNWRFMNWNGNITNNPWMFPVASGTTVCTANFSRISTVSALASPTNGGSVTGGGAFLSGTNIQLTAAASNGWRYVCWSDGVPDNPRTVAVPDSGATFSAIFATTAPVPGTNMIVNGGFEAPVATTNQWYGGGAFALPGWNGSQASFGAGIINGVSFGLAPMNGMQHFVLNGAGSSLAGAYIEQIVGTVSGVVYEVTFGVGRCGSLTTALQLQAQVFGATNDLLFTPSIFYPPSSVGYKPSGFLFTANSAWAKLRFTDQSAANPGADLFVDAVSMVVCTRTVTTAASPANGGSVAGGGQYLVGTNITLAAIASNNWLFTRWNDNDTNATRTITVPTTNLTYTANFSPTATITVNANTNAGGSVTGGGLSFVGNNAVLTATASNNWRFIRWSDGSTNNPRAVAVTASGASYTAVFAPTVLITAQATPANGGGVTGSGTYVVGSNAVLAATSASQWRFISWTDGVTNNPRTVVVPSVSATYTANFGPLATVSVSANPISGGSVSGGGQYVVNSNATVTATASNNWLFMNWNGSVTNNPWTFVVVSNGCACTANFVHASVVSVLANPASGGSASGGGTALSGGNMTLIANAAPGWLFTTWNDGNTNTSRSILVPVANITYTANFVRGIGAAVDATNLTWSTGGNANWTVQSTTTRDGVAALKSGPLSVGQQTWFQTTTNGPGSLLFWWKVSSATNSSLQFFVDTQLVSQISGNVDWNQYVGYIGTSNQVTLTWVYNKGSAAISGSDAGFVDQVTWLPCDYVTNAAQIFYQDPTGTLASWVLTGNGGMRFARLLGNTGSLALKAVGDIDGDGVGDLLFQTANGATTCWFMNADGSIRSTRAMWALGGLTIKACGDYEGTGHTQIFFQDAGGNTTYWRLDTNGNNLGTVTLGAMGGWMLRGLGDLDGDHKAELFWQNAAGQVVIWYHNADGSMRGVAAFSTGGWGLCGVVDIDGDGVGDLLWQDGVGNTGGWFMNSNGTARAASYWWNTGGWKLKAAGR